jgi:hypothetical protein
MAVSHEISCFSCSHSWSYVPPISRKDECPKCHRDSKICLNCKLHDRGAHHECREDQAEWVKDKEKGNFCDFFESRQSTAASGEEDSAKSKLDALFGGKPAASEKKSGSFTDDLQKFIDSKK